MKGRKMCTFWIMSSVRWRQCRFLSGRILPATRVLAAFISTGNRPNTEAVRNVRRIPWESFLLPGYVGQGYSISTSYRLTDGRLEKMENFVHETAGDPNVPPYVINDEEVSEEDFNSRKEKWNQISSHFVTISYDLMTDITDTNIEILLNADYQTS